MTSDIDAPSTLRLLWDAARRWLSDERFWQFVFWASLLYRYTYVFFVNPMDHIFSDPGRHWENGKHFWNPKYFGSIDPIFYQFYLAMVDYFTDAGRLKVAVAIGLLSAVMPYFWYRALAEILPRRWALFGGVVIALMPSMTMIYSYFMNETLLLALFGLGCWLTLRLAKHPNLFVAFLWALTWTAACYTRITAFPLLAIATLYVLMAETSWSRRGVIVAFLAVLFLLFGYEACKHTRVHMNFCAPFGVTYMNEGYRAGHTRGIKLQIIGGGGFGFVSPSMGARFLQPFSDWQRPEEGWETMVIDPEEGRQSWFDEIERIREVRGDKMSWWEDFKVNALVMFFSESWTDNDRRYWLGRANVHNRWLWFPLTLFVLVLSLRTLSIPKRPNQLTVQHMMPAMAFAVILGLLFQTSGMMEGRYRKSFEPLLLASAISLLYHRREKIGQKKAVGG